MKILGSFQLQTAFPALAPVRLQRVSPQRGPLWHPRPRWNCAFPRKHERLRAAPLAVRDRGHCAAGGDRSVFGQYRGAVAIQRVLVAMFNEQPVVSLA